MDLLLELKNLEAARVHTDMSNERPHPSSGGKVPAAGEACRLTVALGLALALHLAWPGAEALGRPALTREQITQLERWEVLATSKKIEGSSVMMGEAIGLFADVPEAVLYVLLDIAKYKHFLPKISDSRVVKRRGWHTYAVVETSMPWPVKDSWCYIKFTRHDHPGRTYEIKWWMINGTLKSYTGSAWIEPWTKDASLTLLTYRLLVEPKTAAPDSTISRGARNVATIFTHRLRLRLTALRKFKKLPEFLR